MKNFAFAGTLVAPLLLAGLGAASPAHAAPGDLIMTMGFVSINNSRSSSTPQHNELDPNTLGPKLGLVPTSFSSPGTEQTIGNAVKPILTLSYFLTDHIAITAVGGVPPVLDVIGHGSVTTPGVLNKLVPPVEMGKAANNPVATVRHWFPSVMMQYHFGEKGDSWHPFVGVGLGYSFFTDVKLRSNFDNNLKLTGGFIADPVNALLGKAAVSTEAKASSAIRPLFNAGISYMLDDKWSLGASVAYVPIKTTATIRVRDKNGSVVLTSKADLDIPTVATSATLGYHF
ncbi:MAG: hypothetical protein KUL75_05920 [Sterolibacterium sp.]|nr:hypothetical protein [Sterolibacterium sp.]